MKQLLVFVLLVFFAHISHATVMVTGSFDKSAGKVFSALAVPEAGHVKTIQDGNDLFSCNRGGRAKYTCDFAIEASHAEFNTFGSVKGLNFSGGLAEEIYEALSTPLLHAGMGRTMKIAGPLTCWRNARPAEAVKIGCRLEGVH